MNLKVRMENLISKDIKMRTFIASDKGRDNLVSNVYDTTFKVVKSKKDSIVIIDDSIVRGTTLKKLVKLLRKSGAKKVHVRISSPPVKHPCFYGMDFPTTEELVAGQHDVDEITDIIDADSLGYLSLDGTLESTHLEKDNFCTACFSGDYPIDMKGKNDQAVPKVSSCT